MSLLLLAGVAVSHDGIYWLRGDGLVEGHRGDAKLKDVGVVLGPNADNWWTLDTCHLAVSDVQVNSRVLIVAFGYVLVSLSPVKKHLC
jgi:hypothetical protein